MHKKLTTNKAEGHHFEGLDLGVVSFFRRKLIEWFAQEGRELPWRGTKDPYKIWVSEVILQQTQVAQGWNYYRRFIERYPTVADLAESSEDDLLLMWQGLGYYSRAHNMHHAAKTIVRDYGGIFPTEAKHIASLKGIGEYTLAAITSIAYDYPLAVVDGNVYRVLSRLMALDIPIDTTTGQKAYKYLANSLLDPSCPGTYNQAIMDLGATVCTPKKPKCTLCPARDICKSAYNPERELRPLKAKRVEVRNLYLDFFLIIIGESFIAEQRGKSSIWKGLYQLPLITSEASHISTDRPVEAFPGLTIAPDMILDTYTTAHRLTHRLLSIRIHSVTYPTIPASGLPDGMTTIPISRHFEFAFPKPLRHFLDTHLK